MKSRVMVILATGWVLVFNSSAAVFVDDAFRALYSAMGVTNATSEAFMDCVRQNPRSWYYDYYMPSRVRVPDSFVNGWYVSLVSATAPQDVGADDTNSWMRAKGYAIRSLSNDGAVRDDTNCWLAVAREIGRMRMKFYSEQDLDMLRGIDGCAREVNADGISIVMVPGLLGEDQRRRDAMAEEIRRTQIERQRDIRDMSNAFDDFTRSSSWNGLPPPERNAMVSNLVEAARFTPAEAAALGLTNVTHQASE